MRDRKMRMRCARCDRPRREDELFSARGICVECARAALEEWQDPDRWKDPEWMLSYRRGMAASVGAILVDDLPDPPGSEAA